MGIRSVVDKDFSGKTDELMEGRLHIIPFFTQE